MSAGPYCDDNCKGGLVTEPRPAIQHLDGWIKRHHEDLQELRSDRARHYELIGRIVERESHLVALIDDLELAKARMEEESS